MLNNVQCFQVDNVYEDDIYIFIYSLFHTHKVYNLFKNNENIKIIVIVNIISTYNVH